MFYPISGPLQPGIRFFQPPIPARQQHALRLACPQKGRRDRVSTFHIVDPMDELGVPSAGGTAVPCRQLGDLQPDHIR